MSKSGKWNGGMAGHWAASHYFKISCTYFTNLQLALSGIPPRTDNTHGLFELSCFGWAVGIEQFIWPMKMIKVNITKWWNMNKWITNFLEQWSTSWTIKWKPSHPMLVAFTSKACTWVAQDASDSSGHDLYKSFPQPTVASSYPHMHLQQYLGLLERVTPL